MTATRVELLRRLLEAPERPSLLWRLRNRFITVPTVTTVISVIAEE
jgi:hypothetical protein